MAPHIIWPTRFVLPHEASLRPAWMIRTGLFLYDHLGGGHTLPGSRGVDLKKEMPGQPLKKQFVKGFEYADCWVDDARLVLFNVCDAVVRGATFWPRTRCVRAQRSQDAWRIELEDQTTGKRQILAARGLVNAAGPWVDRFLHQAMGRDESRVRLVKGSHIVIPKFYEGTHSYLLQHADKRVIFVNPYEGDKLLVGTTDIPFEAAPEDVEISDDEIDYLLAVINCYFEQQTTKADIISTFSGVRPLYDDKNTNASAVTRDYVFDVSDDGTDVMPLLSVYGGKITTYRRLAEHALERLGRYFPNMGGPWTADYHLPGGDIVNADFDGFLVALGRAYPWLDSGLAHHYARCYGTLVYRLLKNCHNTDDLGRHFGQGLYEREVRYCLNNEYARTAEDILWRRTKFGLHLSSAEQREFTAWMQEHASAA
jgi:glycerol-3-phosphate dehydrogenase